MAGPGSASGSWCRPELGGAARAEEGSAMSEHGTAEWTEGPCRTPEARGGEATAVSVDVSEPSDAGDPRRAAPAVVAARHGGRATASDG